MNIDFHDDQLRLLAAEASHTGGYSTRIVEMFRQTLQIVAASPDESVLAKFQCLRYRKTRLRNQRSLALTEDADLLVRIQKGNGKPLMMIEQIRTNGKIVR